MQSKRERKRIEDHHSRGEERWYQNALLLLTLMLDGQTRDSKIGTQWDRPEENSDGRKPIKRRRVATGQE